jgi:23S rRNA-/tRNA-specific pseudouridylate synthase
VTVNGAEARPRRSSARTTGRRGGAAAALDEVIPQEIPLEVLFEDDHLIVLNKQPDIIVHPARAEKSGTLINALAWHFKHRAGAS